MMMRTRLAATAAAALVSISLAASSPQDVAPVIGAVRASNGNVSDLRELCDRVGGRPSGSPQSARAAEWAAKKFRDAGADSVKLEPYTLPAYWRSRSATASCVAPAEFPLRIAAAPSTASTAGEVEATLVDFGDGSPEALAKVGASKGKIAFVHTGIMKSIEDLFGDYMRINPLLDAANRTGVSAMLIESSQPRSTLYRHPMSITGDLVALPVAVVAHDHAERLSRLMEQGEVRVRLRLDNEIATNVAERNVVAEIRGSDLPDEFVVVGAHLDSWDLGTGALDDGINCTTIIDLVRAFKAAGARPRRTIRFVLFTGEEQGMIGSRAYARAHAAEMPKTAMMLAIDIGSGKTTGFFLNGREDLRHDVEQALLPIISDVKQQQNPIDALDGTDNLDFLLYGVPNVVANQDPVPYLPEYHGESDTYDKVDFATAKENEAIYAALLWHFANAATRPATQTRAEVEKLMVEQHVVEQMQAFAQWADWVAGKRGLAK